jgi:hypothetical protein
MFRVTVTRSRLVVALAAASIVVVLLSACSTGGSAPAANAGGSSGNSGSGSGSVTGECPTASAVSGALGATFTGPSKSGGSLTVCTYNDASASVAVTVTFGQAPASASTFKILMGGEANGAALHSVSGLGPAAYSFTTNDGAVAPQLNDSTLGFLSGKYEVIIAGAVAPAKLNALGQLVLSN